MTSGIFTSIPIPSIVVNRSERQRKTVQSVDELAESIGRLGLIHPIVVTRDHVLVAGERRLTACKTLGWTSISAQYVEDLPDHELKALELEENIKRKNITWQEEVLATEEYHALRAAHEDDWSQEKTADALGISRQVVNKELLVAKEIREGNERVANADKFSVALNLVRRVTERKRATALDVVKIPVEDSESVSEVEKPGKPVPILHADFHEWAMAYTGPKFNLIHCDFPYGINVADAPRMGAVVQEHYEDSPDVYWQLINTLGVSMSNVVADSAHLIFWFSMDYYCDTVARLREMGWRVDPFPLIWHKSDSAGIAPDPQRRGRRTYETALFASRGDRKLTEAGTTAISYAYPGKRGDDAIHLSEKPIPMLQHFMKMVCDDYSLVLDPTCGSGNALKAATALGAPTVLGLEKSEEFYTTAVARYYNSLAL